MRLCAFLEAWVQLIWQEGTGFAPGRLSPRQGVAELMLYHKVAALRSQPRRGGGLERLTILKAPNRIWSPPPRSASAGRTSLRDSTHDRRHSAADCRQLENERPE